MLSWLEWLSLPVAIALIGLAARGIQMYRARRRPKLALSVKFQGGSNDALSFSVYVSEVRNLVPARGIVVQSYIEGVSEPTYTRAPFNLAAGQQDRRVSVAVPRPLYGTLVKACNDAPTLYGRTLTVTARAEDGASASATWKEEPYDPETDAARYAAMQEAWAAQPSEPR